ncbi:MAG: hypothetical protein ACREQD_16915, partial [Candidatus Binataceae bacterium]
MGDDAGNIPPARSPAGALPDYRGRDVAVETEPGSTDRDAAGFVLGAAFGILLYQRGALAVHGAAVTKDGRAVAICGASGAGKSTLAAALCRA